MLNKTKNKGLLHVGVELQQDYIALVELQSHRNEVMITACAVYPRKTYQTDLSLAQALRSFLRTHAIRTKNIYVSVSAHKTVQKTFFWSSLLTIQDIEYALSTQQTKYFPGFDEPLNFEVIMRESLEQEKQQATVFAIRTMDLKRTQSLLRLTKIRPLSIEPDSYALLRLFLWTTNCALHPDQAVVFIDFSQEIRILIFDLQEVLFDQTFERGDRACLQKSIDQFCSRFPQYTLFQVWGCGHDRWTEQLNHHDLSLPLMTCDYLSKIHCATEIKRKEISRIALGLALRGIYDSN